MKLEIVYATDDELSQLKMSRIKSYIQSQKAEFVYARPKGEFYFTTVAEENPNVKTIFVFKLNDATINPDKYNFDDVHLRVLNGLEEVDPNSEPEYRYSEGIIICEIDLESV